MVSLIKMIMKLSIRKGDITQEKCDLLVVGMFEEMQPTGGAIGAVEKVLDGLVSKILKEDHFDGKAGSSVVLRPLGFGAKRVLVVGFGKKAEFSEETVRQSAAIAVNVAKNVKAKKIVSAFLGTGHGGMNPKLAGKAIAEGALLAAYDFAKYKSDHKAPVLESFEVIAKDGKVARAGADGLQLGEAYAQGTIVARDLVNEPAQHMRPADLVQVAKDIAGKSKGKVKIKVFDQTALEKMGAGGILGVARGSDHPPFLVHLTYKPANAKKRIALVGKAITFDTGGISLKPADHMMTMKLDMAGAAAVLGAFSALVALQPKVEVHGVFGAAENMPSGNAIVPGDVVRAMNKKTIEVLNTDAEGRVTLADTLTYGVKLKPDMMIDLATLTGACMVALGEEIAGVMSNNAQVEQKVLMAAKEAGENMWALPLEPRYKPLMKSEVADLKNIAGRYGGAITAGLFLQEFVDGVPWAHLDIAGPAFAERPLNAYTKHGGTGFGVRTLLEFVRSL